MNPQCPICNDALPPRAENPSFPFCSERCRLVDLGHWLEEDYRIAEQDDDGGGRPELD